MLRVRPQGDGRFPDPVQYECRVCGMKGGLGETEPKAHRSWHITLQQALQTTAE